MKKSLKKYLPPVLTYGISFIGQSHAALCNLYSLGANFIGVGQNASCYINLTRSYYCNTTTHLGKQFGGGR